MSRSLPDLASRVEMYISDRTNISEEQSYAILSQARLTVVRACPGSGKTRLFAARFAYEVAKCDKRNRGVAALSFTNVAQIEVAKRVSELGVSAGHPHFVGTIDSFLLRFVVRRFGSDMLNLEHFERPYPDGVIGVQSSEHRYGDKKHEVALLSSFKIDVVNDKPTVLVKNSFGRKWQEVASKYAGTIVRAKKEEWLATGYLTHSDVCSIAWKILSDKRVRDIVAARFPVMLVDEFQDTGGFREVCLRLLMSSENFQRGLVVGDPDQCIMEFAGARPVLFSDIEQQEGSRSFSLKECYRSHRKIADVASKLQRDCDGIISCAQEASAEALLLTHSFASKPRDLQSVLRAFDRFTKTIKRRERAAIILTWNGKDVDRLRGVRSKSSPLSCRFLELIYNGLQHYVAGDPLALFDAVEQVLSLCVFDKVSPSDLDLEARALERRQWKRIVWRIARDSCLPQPDNTVQEWVDQVRSGVERYASCILGKKSSYGNKIAARAHSKFKGDVLTMPMAEFVAFGDTKRDTQFTVESVHRVKGQEFDAVCLFVPAPPSTGLGAKASWFGYLDGIGREIDESQESGEARRVAFVAMTRAKAMLMVVIPREWYSELCSFEGGRRFVGLFDNEDEIQLEEYLSKD